MLQVEKSHYEFAQYVDKMRWLSYWHQIDEVMKADAKSVLVIGCGDNLVPSILRELLKSENVYTFDFDEKLKPDFVGDLRDIKNILQGHSVDCILCCQVLEHIEWDSISEILMVFNSSAKRIILSVPYRHITLCNFTVKIGKIKSNIHVHLEIPRFYMNFQFDGQHYWELGTKGYSPKKLIKLLGEYFEVLKKYRVTENRYHMFFVLAPK